MKLQQKNYFISMELKQNAYFQDKIKNLSSSGQNHNLFADERTLHLRIIQKNLQNRYFMKNNQKIKSQLNQVLNKKRKSRFFIDFVEIQYEKNKNLFSKYYKIVHFKEKMSQFWRYYQFVIFVPKIIKIDTTKILMNFYQFMKNRRENILQTILKNMRDNELETLNVELIENIERNNFGEVDIELDCDVSKTFLKKESKFLGDISLISQENRHFTDQYKSFVEGSQIRLKECISKTAYSSDKSQKINFQKMVSNDYDLDNQYETIETPKANIIKKQKLSLCDSKLQGRKGFSRYKTENKLKLDKNQQSIGQIKLRIMSFNHQSNFISRKVFKKHLIEQKDIFKQKKGFETNWKNTFEKGRNTRIEHPTDFTSKKLKLSLTHAQFQDHQIQSSNKFLNRPIIKRQSIFQELNNEVKNDHKFKESLQNSIQKDCEQSNPIKFIDFIDSKKKENADVLFFSDKMQKADIKESPNKVETKKLITNCSISQTHHKNLEKVQTVKDNFKISTLTANFKNPKPASKNIKLISRISHGSFGMSFAFKKSHVSFQSNAKNKHFFDSQTKEKKCLPKDLTQIKFTKIDKKCKTEVTCRNSNQRNSNVLIDKIMFTKPPKSLTNNFFMPKDSPYQSDIKKYKNCFNMKDGHKSAIETKASDSDLTKVQENDIQIEIKVEENETQFEKNNIYKKISKIEKTKAVLYDKILFQKKQKYEFVLISKEKIQNNHRLERSELKTSSRQSSFSKNKISSEAQLSVFRKMPLVYKDLSTEKIFPLISNRRASGTNLNLISEFTSYEDRINNK